MTLALYFLLTFAVTWTAWIVPVALGIPTTSFWFGPGGPLFLLGVFAPGVVALALAALAGGRRGARALLGGIGRWEVVPRLYLFAATYMLAIKLGAAVIHRWWAGTWPPFGETPLVLMALATIASTAVQAGEEVGWRGYALPELSARLGPGTAAIVLGIVWALWHLPLFLIPGTGSEGQSFPVYLLYVTALSIAICWLYWKTGGSLLLTMLMHAAVNNTSGIVPAAVPGATDPWSISGSVVGWASVALAWAVGLVLLYDMHRSRLISCRTSR